MRKSQPWNPNGAALAWMPDRWPTILEAAKDGRQTQSVTAHQFTK